MSSTRPKILFAGGGTGGHLFPALAIAEEIKTLRPDAEILFVGTKDKIESRVVPQKGYAFTTIWISGFHRSFTLDNLAFPVKVMVSYAQSMSLMKKFQPDVVVGTGGYVCGPVLSVAANRGIPAIMHESNSYPGITTRLVAHRATKVFTAFEATSRWLKRKDNIELVGTPVRNSLRKASRKRSAEFFGLRVSKKTVLIFGGSLGATSINSAVRKMLPAASRSKIQIIWQTGEKEFATLQHVAGKKDGFWIGPFIDRMDYAYGAADLVVCRAGATTIAELTALGKPSILVPYPHAAADHQTQNARTLMEAGAAKIVPDHEIGTKLHEAMIGLLSNARTLKRMSAASKKLGHPNAGEVIAKKVLTLIG
ncbi:MAG: undecaprenyldiphospho-muramoylpentapeptide beta-N-acetylglucosaminyltransferase [Ignavibacteriales bacterium]|nr:undecaprenyldiphospho-muramoylpentapeptide beta-N-acetylglucosaminyltransferase [Ignavibacteriales bacterium]